MAISGGRIIVPRIDPRGPPGAAYAAYNGVTWADDLGPTVEHCFAAAEADGHLFLAGSQEDGQHGGIWVSDDDGATWELQVTSTEAADFARFYFLAVLGSAVYAQEAGESPGAAIGWKWTAAEGWQQIDRFLPDGVNGGRPRSFDAGVVIPSTEPAVGSSGTLHYFDGVTTTTLVANAQTWTVHDGLVWALNLADGILITVDSTGSVTPLTTEAVRDARPGVHLRTMIVLGDGSILFGTSAGDVALLTSDQLA